MCLEVGDVGPVVGTFDLIAFLMALVVGAGAGAGAVNALLGLEPPTEPPVTYNKRQKK